MIRLKSWFLGVVGLLAIGARAASAPPPFSDELLARAVAEAPPRWKGTPGQRYREMKPVMALQLVAVAAHAAPDRKIGERTLAAVLAEKLQSFLRSSGPDAEGHTREPEAEGGLGGWTHNAAAQALLLAKRTPAVWEKFTPDDRRRADLVMHALALAAHFTLDDDNDFCTLLEGVSITHKSWNPNITEPYADIALAASLYFGSAELDTFFVSFDFDRFVGELRAANFLNIAHNWTNVPAIKDLMMNGGEMTGPGGPAPGKLGGVVGRGAGVRHAFHYRGWGLDRPWEIYRIQADRQFSRTVRTVVTIDGENRTHLLQRATKAEMSPWEGRMGMMLEFESTDWEGLRSSLGYAFEGAMIQLGTAATLRVLGEWKGDASGRDLEQRMAVGVADLMFKAREGYRGWSLGKERLNWYEQDLEPLGADYVFPLWSELFPPPAPAVSRAALELRSHSHNDYAQAKPLATALENHMGSVEADVWLIDGELRLGHSRNATRAGWTLRSDYLDPLKARLSPRGVVYGGTPLVLLIDIKSEAEPTYEAIARELATDATLFTRFAATGSKPGAITVIISGAVPRAKIAEAAERLAACDGRPADLETNPPASLVPLISDNWKNLFRWDGAGEMPVDERAKLRELADRCHQQGRKFRLWNAPDVAASWREQLDAGVDYINTDQPATLHAFLAGR